jgi:cephalosporin-C deacetylase
MKRLTIIFYLFLALSATSQNLIDNQWLFNTGDSLAWKNLNYNALSWKTIKSGIAWEYQGFANYDGFAWYRKTIIIPEQLKKDAFKNGGLNLNLGAIDDADQIYFNGKLIGATGALPPNYVSAYDKIRDWNINPQDVQWGKENVIAVRVYDESGNGGIMGENISLKMRGLETGLSIKALFPTDNQILVNSPKLNFSVTLSNSSVINLNSKAEFYLLNDFKDTVLVWNEPIKLSAGKSKTIKIDKPLLEPGFYTLYVAIKSNLLNFNKSFTFGIDPEKIVSPTDIPADFDNFWLRAKRELAAVDPQFKLIKKDSLCTAKRDVYLVEMRSLENVLIRGWYARPKAAGKFPAILHVQGYSSSQNMSSGYAGDDMAVLVLNVRGHGNSKDNINPGFPGYLQYSLKDKEKYIYRGAYMDCVRAVDFLCSREEVDSRYIVVEGGSQGGALSFATAALDNKRISLCIPAVPFLSDFPDYFKVADWPANEFKDFVANNPAFGWKGVFETLRYFDIKNLAPWIKCPVLMSIGLKDITCPPHINFAAYNQLNAPKEYVVYPDAGHGLPAEYMQAKVDWMKKELEKLSASKLK